MGAVDTTYTFTATDTITSSKMNNIIDQTTITGDAIFGTTLEVASGKLKVRSQGVTSNELATNAVTETKITDGSVTPAKLSAGSPSWTATTGFSGLEIGDGITTDTTSYIDLHSSSGVDYNARILRESGVNGNFVISNTGTGSIKFNDVPLGAVSGVAPIFGARAFVNFNADSAGIFDGGGSTVSRSAGSTLCTVTTANNHNLITGHRIYMAATGITAGAFAITKTGDKTFTFISTQTTLMTASAVTFSLKLIVGGKNISCVSLIGTGQYIVNLSIPMVDSNYCVVSNTSETLSPRASGSPTTEQTENRFVIYTDTFDGSACQLPTITAVVFS